jgi:hypothetical protein
MGITADDIKTIVDAITQLPQWRFLEDQMMKAEAEGATPGADTVGDALPDAQSQRLQQQHFPTGPEEYRKSSLYGSMSGHK